MDSMKKWLNAIKLNTERPEMSIIRSITYNFYAFIEGVSNLKYYFKYIWNDSCINNSSIEDIIYAKLKRHLEFYENPENVHSEEERRLYIVKYLRIACSLLEKLQVSNFATKEELDYVRKCTIVFEDIPNSSLSEMKFIDNGTDPEMRLRIYSKWDERERKTRRLLYLIMEKRSIFWWD